MAIQKVINAQPFMFFHPADEFGQFHGEGQKVLRGVAQVKEIVQRGRGGKRLMVKATYYGKTVYGWVNKEDIVKEEKERNPSPKSVAHAVKSAITTAWKSVKVRKHPKTGKIELKVAVKRTAKPATKKRKATKRKR